MGLTVTGYPNFFVLYGPHTNQGGNSIIVILEAQASYFLSALRATRWRRARAVDVRRAVMDAYNRELHEALDGPSGTTDARALSRTPTGKIAAKLPQTSRWYVQRTNRFRMKEYVHHESSGVLRDRKPRRLSLRGGA
jgi:cyclohexanone monooxygenase